MLYCFLLSCLSLGAFAQCWVSIAQHSQCCSVASLGLLITRQLWGWLPCTLPGGAICDSHDGKQLSCRVHCTAVLSQSKSWAFLPFTIQTHTRPFLFCGWQQHNKNILVLLQSSDKWWIRSEVGVWLFGVVLLQHTQMLLCLQNLILK